MHRTFRDLPCWAPNNPAPLPAYSLSIRVFQYRRNSTGRDIHVLFDISYVGRLIAFALWDAADPGNGISIATLMIHYYHPQSRMEAFLIYLISLRYRNIPLSPLCPG